MMLGARSVASERFVGANLVLLKDWVPAAIGAACFKAFDESLARLRSDRDATRVITISGEQAALSDYATASEAARRALPERLRPLADLFTIVAAPNPKRDGRELLWNLPAWATVHIENTKGELYRVRAAAPAKGWDRAPLEAGDLFVHVALFGEPGRIPLEGRDPGFHRLSTLIEEAAGLDGARVVTFALRPIDLV